MILLWMACETSLPETVKLTGTVYDAPYLQGQKIAGEALTTLDENGGTVGEAVSADDGSFEMDAPAGGTFFLTVEGDHPTTTFSGTTGFVDLNAGDGLPWFTTQVWVDRLHEDFANCGNVPTDGAIAVGEIRIYLPGVAPWDSPFANTAAVKVTGSDGVAAVTCVLDDDGTSVEYGEQVGTTGRFAAFGLPEGPLVVGVSYEDATGNISNHLYRGMVAADGVAPFYPIYVSSGS